MTRPTTNGSGWTPTPTNESTSSPISPTQTRGAPPAAVSIPQTSRESSQRAHRFRHSHRHPDERMCFARWLCHHHRSQSYLRVRRNKNKLRPPAPLGRSTAGYFPSLRSAMVTSLRLIQHTKYPRHQIGRNQYAKRSLQNDSAYPAPPMSGAHTCSTHSRRKWHAVTDDAVHHHLHCNHI